MQSSAQITLLDLFILLTMMLFMVVDDDENIRLTNDDELDLPPVSENAPDHQYIHEVFVSENTLFHLGGRDYDSPDALFEAIAAAHVVGTDDTSAADVLIRLQFSTESSAIRSHRIRRELGRRIQLNPKLEVSEYPPSPHPDFPSRS